MKKILIALLVAGLFQGFAARAQDFGRHGGHGGDSGGPARDNGGNGGDRFGNGGGQSSSDRGDAKARPEKPKNKAGQNGRLKTRPAKPTRPSLKNYNGRVKNNLGQPRWNQPSNRNRNNAVRTGNPQNGFSNQGGAVNRGNRATLKTAPPQNRISPRLQQMGVRRLPPSFANRNAILRTDRAHSAVAAPRVGPNGAAFRASIVPARNMSSLAIRNHMAQVSNHAFITAQVGLYNRRETQVNHYYWHSYNGFNFCHYNDPWGYHWYGWNVGPRFFWSRWYGDHWWWYDPVYYRWCYWYGGQWWWPDPYQANVVYVYNDGNYVPADYSQAEAAPESSFRSKDGDRTVKLVNGDAFLYDTTDNPSFKPVYLASNASKANFSYDENGNISQVLVTLKDGSFQLFDAQGNPYNGGDANDNGAGNAGGDNSVDNGNQGPSGGPSNSPNPPDSGNPPDSNNPPMP